MTDSKPSKPRVVSMADLDDDSGVNLSFLSGKDADGKPIVASTASAMISDLPDAIRAKLVLHGLKAKLSAGTNGAEAAAGEAPHETARRGFSEMLAQLKSGVWNSGRSATGGRGVTDLVDAMCLARVKSGKPELRDTVREAVMAATAAERHKMLFNPAVMAAAAELAAQKGAVPSDLDGLLDD